MQFLALSSTQIQVWCKIQISTVTKEGKGTGGTSLYNQGAAPVIPLYFFTFFFSKTLSFCLSLPCPGQDSRERYLKRLRNCS